MQGVDPTILNGLPSWVVLMVYAIIGIGIAGAALHRFFFRKENLTHEQATDMVLQSGTIADLKPIRDAVVEIRRIAVAAEKLVTMIAEQQEGAELDRRVEERVRQALAGVDREEEQRRPPGRRS